MRARASSILAAVLILLPLAAWAAATFSVSPDSISFTSRCVRTASNSKRIVFANESNQDARDVAIRATPSAVFEVDGGPVDTVPAGGRATFSARFVPQRAGAVSGQALIDFGAANPPSSSNPSPSASPKTRKVSLSGSGIDRFIDASPDFLQFSDVRVGQSAEAKVVTVYDDGDSPLQVKSISIIGRNAADFSVRPSKPVVVTDGSPLTLRVSFTARGPGARRAQLKIDSDSCVDETVPARNIRVDLAGAGIEPDVVSTPTEVDFGQPAVKERAVRGLSVANQGRYKLLVRSIELDGDPSFELLTDPGLPRTLEPGQAIDLRVAFKSATEGERRARIVVASNDPDTKRLKIVLRADVPEPLPVAEPTELPEPSPSPTATAPPVADGSFLGEVAGELLIASSIVAFFAGLFVVRKVRGVPE
ncbi:MAG TPA: choice-of-anchor D domain-containing protein [Actinomycetota bacterium]